MVRTAGTGFALLIGWLAAAVPTFAIPPPLPPTSHYGPVRFCAADFAIDVAADEAVSWTDYGATTPVTLLTLDHVVTAELFGESLRGAPLYRNFARGRTVRVDLGDGQRAERFTIVDGNGDRSTGYVRRFAGADGAERLILFVGARLDGSARDVAALRRFRIGPPQATGCTAPTWTDRAFVAGADGRAALMSPAVARGPALICGDGLAFALEAGESAPLYWPRGRSGPRIFEVSSGDRYYNVRWPSVRARTPVTPEALGGPGLPVTVETSGGARSLTVVPRESREAQNVLHFGIVIAGPGGAAEDLAVLHRFRSVADDDPHCFRAAPAG